MSTDDSLVTPEILENFSSSAMQDSLYLRLAMHYVPWTQRGRWKRVVESVEQNVPLEQAVEQHRATLPNELYSLLRASLHLPEPGGFVLSSLKSRWERQRLTRRFAAILAYPTIMLVIALVLACFVSSFIAPMLISAIEEFDLMGNYSQRVVEDQRSANFGMLAVLLWCGLVWLTIYMIGPRWALLCVLGGLPYVGKTFRWLSLYEVLSRLEAVSLQGVRGSVASQRVAESFIHHSVEIAAHSISQRIAGGSPVGSAICRSQLSDGLCGPVLLSLDRSSRKEPAFGHAAEVLLRLTELRLNTLAMVVPFVVFLLIANLVVGVISTYAGLLLTFFRLLTAF